MDIKSNNTLPARGLGNGATPHALGGQPRPQALGKGLGALIPTRPERRDYFECALDRIKRAPDQPRRIFDETALQELAESIRVHGLIQPLVVRQDGSEYRLIAGERRFRAAKLLGLETVPVVIKDVSHDEAFALALIENIQRQDLNPVEEAEAYQRLMDLRGYTQEQAAGQVGKSRSAVANTLRLLQLPDAVQRRVSSGEFSGGAARALLALPEQDLTQAADACVEHQLTVRQIESLARRVKAGAPLPQALEVELYGEHAAPLAPPQGQLDLLAPPKPPKPEPAEPPAPLPAEDRARRRALAREIAQNLGVKTSIRSRGVGGTLPLSFEDSAALHRVVALLLAHD